MYLTKKIFLFTIVFSFGFVQLNYAQQKDTKTTNTSKTETPKKKEEPKKEVKVTTQKSDDPNSLSWRKNKKLAKKLLKKGSYYNAAQHLEAGALKKPKKQYFATTLADAEMQLRDYKSANKWYKVLVDKDSAKHKKPLYLYNYAMTQKYLGQYEDAQQSFKKFVKYAGDDDAMVETKKRAKRESEGCNRGIYYRDSVTTRAFKVKHLDAGINNPFTDYGAVNRSESSMYYGSLKSDKVMEVKGKEKLAAYSRIYKSTLNGKSWNAGEEISENINTANTHVGNPAFSADGSTMYYTECIQDDNLKMKCKILYSKNVSGIWEKGKSVNALVNDPLYNNTHPAVGKNKDGETVLYFASDRNVGKGMDLFTAKINDDGSVAKPRSVGPQINTKYDEVTPFFDARTNTLYFSSNGWINIGGFDIYQSHWDNGGEWTEPENLGTPVNSSVDDMYFTLNDKATKGFVVSNRPGGFGLKSETCCDDIYQLETTKLFLAVKGTIFEQVNENKNKTENATVILQDERNGVELGSFNTINGGYFFDLKPNNGYKLIAKKEGFMDSQLSFNTDGKEETDTVNYDLTVKKVVQTNPLIGRVIGILYYDYDKSKLRDDSRDTLRKVNDIMEQYPNIVVEIGSHTDANGTVEYNEKLALRRAEAVTNYLIYEKKIAPERLISKSYGKSMPAAPNTKEDGSDNPEGRALNRRTEFKIVDEIKK